jgi:hypothetical protein
MAGATAAIGNGKQGWRSSCADRKNGEECEGVTLIHVGGPGGARGCLRERCRAAMWCARHANGAPWYLLAQVTVAPRFKTNSKLKPNSNWFETETIFKMPSLARKISNKILICGELNKEQFSSLEFLKNWNGIWIKNQRAYLSQIWLNSNPRDFEASKFDGILHVRP